MMPAAGLPSATRSHAGPALVGFVLFVVLFAVARSVDVPRTGYGVKSDEATYVAMALSAAYDADLTYERRDLERFTGIYHGPPNGIFLKRGKVLRIAARDTFPFVRVVKTEDPRTDRLYFGKAYVYSVLAAPFVRAYGLNGMLLFNLLLLSAVAVCGYLFLAAQSPPAGAALFTTAFLGAAALPVYGVFLMPEIFNLALVFVAYFLWLYKEVRPGPRQGLAGRWTDIAAAILLGVATYSKPLPVALLVAPLVAHAWWRRSWARGFALGSAAVAAASALFLLNAAITGEFNYQGGDRKTFVERFPFDRPGATWASFGGTVIDDPGQAAQAVLTSRELPARFARNVWYFMAGRHFGFIPYYFPGLVAVAAWLLSPARRDRWRLLVAAGFAVAAAVLLLVLPFTWSGGGGPPGNRYALSAYPILFFLMPPTASLLPGVAAWFVGALFTAKMLVNPFVAAKFTWELYERGLARRLPVELTMSQDLPVMLAQPLRARILYGHDPFLLLYFLDQNAWPPEPPGMWVSGAGRADIIVRAERPIRHLEVEAESRIRTTLTVALGADPVAMEIQPGRVATFEVLAAPPVPGRYGDSVYLMTTQSSDGFVPGTMDGTTDYRNLGALMRFRAVLR
jgi:hypothetical protein